jgi:transposase
VPGRAIERNIVDLAGCQGRNSQLAGHRGMIRILIGDRGEQFGGGRFASLSEMCMHTSDRTSRDQDPRTLGVHFFVFTLGFSRRAVAYAYRNERLDTLLDGHERALRHFGGVPLSCLDDNPRTITTGRSAGHVLWHPRFEDFARYYGFTPRARQPYRARTKGKVESGVKYVKRNALAVGVRDDFRNWIVTAA